MIRPDSEGSYTSYSPRYLPPAHRYGYTGSGHRSRDPQIGDPLAGNRSWQNHLERDAPMAPGYDRCTGAFIRLPAYCEFHLGEPAQGCQVCAAGSALNDVI